MNLPIEMILEIFSKDPSMHFNFTVLCKETSKKTPFYDGWDVLINLGYTVEICKGGIFWKKNNKLHSVPNKFPAESRDEGDAKIEVWRKNGEKHREGDLPAETLINQFTVARQWYIDGSLHRDSGPASIIDEWSFRDGRWMRIVQYCHHGVLVDRKLFPDHAKVHLPFKD